jgi:GAF domain-containing protein
VVVSAAGTAGGNGQLYHASEAPAGHDGADKALRLAVALVQLTVEQAEGVTVSVARGGRLVTVAASDPTVEFIDAQQYATGEGPCLDVHALGRSLYAAWLERESRWPLFVPKALSVGVNSILSIPLLASAGPVGAINLYSRAVQAFAPGDQEFAASVAAEISRVLWAPDTASETGNTEQFSAALRVGEFTEASRRWP